MATPFMRPVAMYHMQTRSMSHVEPHSTLRAAINSGKSADQPFDVSGGGGDIVWTWEERDWPRYARSRNRAGSNYTTDDAYDQRSKSEARADAARIARDWAQASPRERREDEAAFLDALKDPSLIAERVSWLIDGNYGRGQYLHAREVLRNTRMNRKAWLVTAIGEAEWRLPRAVAARVWTRLTPAQRAALDRVMESIIRTPLDEDS